MIAWNSLGFSLKRIQIIRKIDAGTDGLLDGGNEDSGHLYSLNKEDVF